MPCLRSGVKGYCIIDLGCRAVKVKKPVTGLEWPRVFQEVKVPRFHDNGTGRW